jgi:hypothetical protein
VILIDQTRNLFLIAGRDATRNLKAATERHAKAAVKCDRLHREAAEIRERLMEARLALASGNPPASITPTTVTKLTEQCSDKMDEAAEALLRTEEARTLLNRFRIAYDEGMQTVMSGLAENDEARGNNLKASLRRHLVIETSFLANRQYDGNALVSVFEEIDPAADLQRFTERTLAALPSASGGSASSPDSYTPSPQSVTPSASVAAAAQITSASTAPSSGAATPSAAGAAGGGGGASFTFASGIASVGGGTAVASAASVSGGGGGVGAAAPPTATVVVGGLELDPRRPLPYCSQKRRRAAQRRPKKDLVEDLTFWMPGDKVWFLGYIFDMNVLTECYSLRNRLAHCFWSQVCSLAHSPDCLTH